MPYTPPARSPVSSGTTTPAQTRLQIRTTSPPQTPNGRPNLPRSASSSTYLQKSRRSPAYSEDGQDLRSDSGIAGVEDDGDNDRTIPLSLRQSPPPMVDSNQMPPGAILSPPDSTHNSSDDEDGEANHRVEDLEKLQKDLRTLELRGGAASPDEEISPTSVYKDRKIEGLAQLADSAILSPSARKVTHSRSATEGSFFDRRGSLSSQATSEDDEDDEDSGSRKPPLLRKKSGELVKPAIRPCSRRRHSSMPGTPTYSKAVHFDEQIEHVRHFLQVDRPIAVSAGGSPVDSHDDEVEFPFQPETKPGSVSWSIRLANYPPNSFERHCMPVRLEKIELSHDEKNLIGQVAVANISFQKGVAARFTLDYWNTTSEVGAEFSNDPRHKNRDDGYDVFTFQIRVSDQANLETRTLLLCVRYNVNGQEFWDSNNGQNFQVDFVKNIMPPTIVPISNDSKSASQGAAARPIPRSRHNSNSSTRGRPLHTLDDDFAKNFDVNTSNIRLRSHNQVPSSSTTPPTLRRPQPNAQQFGVRYDFGASLSAALSQAQAQLGDRSGIKFKRSGTETDPNTPRSQARPLQPEINGPLNPSAVAVPTTSGVDSPRPEALLANKHPLDSKAYQEFVSKFCFYGSKAPAPSSVTRSANGTDGTHDTTSSTSLHSTTENSQTKQNPAMYYDASGGDESSTSSQISSGSSSPTPTNSTTPTARMPSPSTYPFLFRSEGRQNLFPQSPAATAIHG